MTVKRSADLIDVLDRVLDRGIVIEAWAVVSLAGIHLIDAEARIVVTSCPTYLSLTDNVAVATPVIITSARRRARRSSGPRTWFCDHGCTFQRSGRWSRAVVPCPDNRRARCPVRTV